MAMESKTINVDSINYHYVEQKSSEDSSEYTIVCIHGMPGSYKDFKKLIPKLAEKNRVIAVDVPGFGDSDKPLGVNYGFKGTGERLLKFMEALDLKRVIVVGHSFGGGFSQYVAAHGGSRVVGLLLICSIGPTPHMTYKQLIKPARLIKKTENSNFITSMWAFAFRPFVKLSPFPVSVVKENAAMMAVVNTLVDTDFDELEQADRNISVPVVLITAKRDKMIYPWIADKLEKTIPALKRITVDTSSHFLQFTHIDDVLGALGELMDSLPAVSSTSDTEKLATDSV